MIIDCFTFFNELDMLECRLEYLYPHVDYFVICEANYTHSGIKKEFNYLNNKSRFEKYANKIIYIQMEVPEGYDFTNSWSLEQEQRNKLIEGLEKFDDDDIVIISDLDEIPNVEVFSKIIDRIEGVEAFTLCQELFYYNLSTFVNDDWKSPKVTTKKTCIVKTPNYLRTTPIVDTHRIIKNGGWHLSYCFSPEGIKNKIESFAHQEYNKDEYKGLDHIAKCISEKKDVYGRCSFTDKKKEDFPQEFIKVFERFY